MVDNALFSIFHRLPPKAAEAPPKPVSEPPPSADPAPGLAGTHEPREDLTPAEASAELATPGQGEDISAPDGEAAEHAASDEPAEPGLLPVAASEPQPLPAEPSSPLNATETQVIPTVADQLGLASPEVITLRARLPSGEAVELDATGSGIYRPHGFQPAPWSGFAYDQGTQDDSTGVLAGTRILTARGEVEVEKLVPGDAALTLRGPALMPISWIGRSTAAAKPIRVEAGALGPNLPRRPLSLGPDQSVFIDPTPVAAHTLVNGTTIRPYDHDDDVDLFHIDVGSAEILLAEGVPLSSGSRPSPQTA